MSSSKNKLTALASYVSEEDVDGWYREVLEVYQKMSMQDEWYQYTDENSNLVVLPEVFSPAYFTSSAWFAKTVPNAVRKGRLLEIGTGTGIVSIACAENGHDVVATDVSHSAVANAEINAYLSGVPLDVRLGHLYEPVEQELFDTIFWNHPSLDGIRPESALEDFWMDFEFSYLNEYISQAENHLKPGGNLLLGTASDANQGGVRVAIECGGYTSFELARTKRRLSIGTDLEGEYMLLQLEKQ